MFCRACLLFSLTAVGAPALADGEHREPSVVRCKATSNIGCDENGICIADNVRDRHPITFKLRSKRFSSNLGSGRITQEWDLPDGRHTISVSAPPASGEFVFSQDWLSAYGRGSIGYACEIHE